MSLRVKIELLLFVVFTLVVALGYWVQSRVTLSGLRPFEEKVAIEDMDRSVAAIEDHIALLDSLCSTWSTRPDIVHVIQDGGETDIEPGLTLLSLIDNDLTFFYLIDIEGTVVWRKTLDWVTQEESETDTLQPATWPPTHPLLVHTTPRSSISGVYLTSSGPALVSSYPVATDNDARDPLGRLIIGRVIKQRFLTYIYSQTGASLRMWAIDTPVLPLEVRKIFQEITDGNLQQVSHVTEHAFRVYRTYPDVVGDPALLLQSEVRRDLLVKVYRSLKSGLLVQIGIGLGGLVVLIVIARIGLINPLEKLTSHMVAIGKTDDLSARLSLKRNDEIGEIANELDRMAERLEKDIEDREHTEQLLREHEVFHDPLTGLPNRVLFLDRLGQALRRLEREKDYLFAVLFLDLDRFKVVNDGLGHLVGDQLLKAFAKRLQSTLRTADTVGKAEETPARFGGDEFVILLDGMKDISNAFHVADRIQDLFSTSFQIGDHEVFLSVSIGIALSTTCYGSPDDVLRDADNAMYRAKEQGKARYEVFDSHMHAEAKALAELESAMRRGINQKEFLVYYQPIISLKSGKIEHLEALVRWQHPERGLISPFEFLPLAEETGMIVPIGQQILRDACRQTRLWQELPSFDQLCVNVNLSVREFSEPNLIDSIENILSETGLDPSRLMLEITESVVMKDIQSVIDSVKKLQALNIELSIDDFGTGYSSLSYLHLFPIDSLKIDQSFVKNLHGDPGTLQIMESIVLLAHNLRMSVVAEGIEDEKQLNTVYRLKCNYGQGYYFSPPVDAEAATELIVSNSTWPVAMD